MAWYSSWTRAQRLAITVPAATVAPLPYFPVVLTAASLPTELTNNTYGRSDGGDLAFAADLGAGNSVSSIGAQLPCEVVSAAFGGSPSAEIHVQVPSVAATGTLTYVWVLYGNSGQTAQPAAGSTYGSQKVWIENGTQNYQGVWHLNSATVSDSTGLSANGTNTGTPTVVGGQLGSGLSYSSAQYCTMPAISALGGATAAGITAWVQRNASDAFFTVAGICPPYATYHEFEYFGYSNGNVYNYANSLTFYTYFSSNTTTWTKYDLFFNGTALLSYVNGSAVSVTTSGTCPSSLTGGYAVGLNNSSFNNFGTAGVGNASYDEVRIATAVRSVSWIAAEYSNQYAPGTFIAPSGTPLPILSTTLAAMLLLGF